MQDDPSPAETTAPAAPAAGPLPPSLPLPPAELRMNGPAQKDDAVYMRYAALLVRAVGSVLAVDDLSRDRRGRRELSEMRIADLGCGTARFLHGLAAAGTSPASYVGFDVQPAQIDWCSEALSPRGPFEFRAIDVHNDRYNPQGGETILGKLGEAGAFDLVMIRSVFTHFETIEALLTLQEVRRVTAEHGRVYLTVNVDLAAPPWSDSPRAGESRQTLLRTQFNKTYFENMIEGSGFRVSVFAESVENQGVYLLRPA